jgi:hypothetical protein
VQAHANMMLEMAARIAAARKCHALVGLTKLLVCAKLIPAVIGSPLSVHADLIAARSVANPSKSKLPRTEP